MFHRCLAGKIGAGAENIGSIQIWSNYSDHTRPAPPKGSFLEGKWDPGYFRGNLGWWNIIPFGQIQIYHGNLDSFYLPSFSLRRDQRDLQLEVRSEPSIPKLQMQRSVQLMVPRPPQRGSLAELQLTLKYPRSFVIQLSCVARNGIFWRKRFLLLPIEPWIDGFNKNGGPWNRECSRKQPPSPCKLCSFFFEIRNETSWSSIWWESDESVSVVFWNLLMVFQTTNRQKYWPCLIVSLSQTVKPKLCTEMVGGDTAFPSSLRPFVRPGCMYLFRWFFIINIHVPTDWGSTSAWKVPWFFRQVSQRWKPELFFLDPVVMVRVRSGGFAVKIFLFFWRFFVFF